MKSGFNIILLVVISFLLLFNSGNILAQAAYDTVSIYDLQYVPDPATDDVSPLFGDTVVVKGMVMTNPRDLWVGARWSVYIIDPDSFPKPWSGFFIIQDDSFETGTQLQFVQPGDIAYFTGRVDEFDQFSQVNLLTNPPVLVNIVNTGTLPEPKVLTAADLSQSEGEQWEGMWVQLNDLTVVNSSINGDWASVTDASGATTYLGSYFNWFNDHIADGSYHWPSNGSTINVKGLTQDDLGSPGQVFIVNPRDTNDVEITGDPPPVIQDVARIPGAPTSSDNVVVSAGSITDNGSVDSAWVYYSVNEGSFQSVNMGHVGNSYFATIPAQSDGNFVRYFIYAEDDLGGGITEPGDTSRASGGIYFYTVRDGDVLIQDVQSTHGYFNDASGYDGYEVTLQGIVMTDSTDLIGDYYIQDAQAMWSGIWINDDPNKYSKGDEVSVTGTIDENFGVTQLDVTSSSLVTAGVGEFSPIDVTTGEIAGVNGEAYESVLVRVQNVTVTDPFPDGYPGFGEFEFDDGTGPLRADDFFSAYSGQPQNGDTTYALGDHISYIIAVGYYSFSNYKLAPRDSNDIGTVTGIENNDMTIPSDFTLRQNYPNPFNPTTEIEYSIATSGNFSINIYNILGQKVRTLVNFHHSVGSYRIQWDGMDDNHQQVGSGIYFYSLKGDRVSLTKKMILLK